MCPSALRGSVRRHAFRLAAVSSATKHALTNYMKFVDLWSKADPELQPKVAEVRAKIARLSKVEGK